MKPRPIFKKLFRVALTSLLYVLFFNFFYYGFYLLFGLRYPSFSLFITLLIVLFFHEEITWKVREFIDKNFYRKVFITNKALQNFNIKLNVVLDFQILVADFINFLQQTFHENSWVFYYCWGEDFELFEKNRIDDEVPKLVKLPDADELNKIFNNETDFFTLHKLKQKYKSLNLALRNIPQTERYYYLFPMKSYKGYVGFLIFDRSFSYYLHFPSLKHFILRILKKSADVFENNMLHSEIERKSLQNFLLLEIGKKISSSLDINEVLEAIIDSIKQLVNYDAGGIFLVDEHENRLRRMVTVGYDKKTLDKITLKLNKGIYGWVIKNREVSLINDVSQNPYYFKVRETTNSQLTVPLSSDDEVIGVIALESDKINHFTPADKELLMTFASQAVTAIENAQLYEESVEKGELESELVVASMVQKALLPDKPPELPGLQVSFQNIPSRIVGGDFYDVFRLGDVKLGIAIGDVSGKGAPASILMAMLYAGFRSLLKEIYPVVEVVARLNNLLTETTEQGYFVSFFFGIYNQTDQNMTYTNAGHNAPILLDKERNVKRLAVGGPVLGFMKDLEYHQETISLKSGDYLVLFTDGVSEVKDSQGDEYGEERLVEFLKQNYGRTASEIRSKLIEEIQNFSAQRELPDDATYEIIYIE